MDKWQDDFKGGCPSSIRLQSRISQVSPALALVSLGSRRACAREHQRRATAYRGDCSVRSCPPACARR
ncbi:hypothetical protein PF005_g30425 [Phytophthora fragariae]|uniref:Uncharacterized protein n=1 Tax=Phytophthora fragariae TaxID=53985 RepID=A0A6A3VBJ9_9STRA|nr:hypothetical protein PF009_g30616 [Phytophthora fragariae]KAE8962070.1 hypothetical protein PF011_g29521 [Phytophthora fragariae]KAE9060789.1 hypothetical protein PF010_g30077 [Phytophthora fragariae]KAE9061768.1 hypothetical protein PF007_g30142 [Phytophthora fragariae]KAE9066796.1 hypothetical protein PF006_g30139 [Phytophthora fragariae]